MKIDPSMRYYDPSGLMTRRRLKIILLKLSNDRCVWCNCRLNLMTISIDHYIPRTQRSKYKDDIDSIDNLVASCEKCNTNRKSRLPLYYIWFGGMDKLMPDFRTIKKKSQKLVSQPKKKKKHKKKDFVILKAYVGKMIKVECVGAEKYKKDWVQYFYHKILENTSANKIAKNIIKHKNCFTRSCVIDEVSSLLYTGEKKKNEYRGLQKLQTNPAIHPGEFRG